ncbi:hypothetical protein MIU24_11595 [Streptomyces venezuelae]|uniref:TRADD-N-associated membrane domain-containing protein n=1 Tax=Streptomyces sp. B6(2022) TaxID=3404749 RepID=UPI0031201FEF
MSDNKPRSRVASGAIYAAATGDRLSVTAAVSAMLALIGVGAAGFLGTAGKQSSADRTVEFPTWFLIAISVIVALGLVAAVTAIALKGRRQAAERKAQQERLDNAADRLREHMELASLVNFNRVLLEDYHGVATRQANKSFVAAIVAMAVGLAALVTAFIASMQFTATGERVFIGSLAALATVFVGYLSKTFLAVYDRSLQQLNQYFNQPVLNQYFLTAERITEQLDGDLRNDLKAQIVMDVLETGKQMHQVSGGAPKAQAKAPKIGRQRSGKRQQAGQPQPSLGSRRASSDSSWPVAAPRRDRSSCSRRKRWRPASRASAAVSSGRRGASG